jgi:putative transposase
VFQYGVQLDFIRPGRPVENSYIESFNGRLRDEWLNVEVFFTLIDVREKLELWRQDYNQVRPHSSLHDLPSGAVRTSMDGYRAVLSGEALIRSSHTLAVVRRFERSLADRTEI